MFRMGDGRLYIVLLFGEKMDEVEFVPLNP
jgi:hypothetical protein